MIIREIQKSEYYLLEDFLYEAIFQKDESIPLPKAIIKQPELSIYIENFGTKVDDKCFVAIIEEKIVGMVWVRTITGYGSVDEVTPEFAISVKKDFRNQGIGKKLMQKMIEYLKSKKYKQASLSVQKDNYALTMYKNIGFKIIDENTEEYVMIYTF